MSPLLRLLNLASPAVAIGVLVTAMVVGGTEVRPVAGTDEYHARVRDAIEGLPYKIGDWIGLDVQAPPEAVQMLKPNKIMQRRFVNPGTGEVVNVLLVHCGDVRDMLGHYPPQCYPAHGWMRLGERDTSVSFPGGTFPARRYSFGRPLEHGDRDLDVINFFVLPGHGVHIVGDMDSLFRASQSVTRTGLGAAQVQLLSNGPFSPLDRKEVVELFLRAIEPAVRVVANGVQE